ncbi:MAG: c-type cytochrome [Desulfuromonadales bacterium]|nr:c-type cytochrome [Desulfuromonadales bacterium]
MWRLTRQIIVIASFIVAGLLIQIEPLAAHGDEKHGKANEMSNHMQAMYALKGEIPEEYRIMERTPIIPDKQSLNRGKELYNQQCAVCHGKEGRGDGAAAKSLTTPPANFLDLEHSSIYGPGEKFWILGNGSGDTGMPAFPQIDLVDRWNLVNYVLELQGPENMNQGQMHHH